MRSELVVSVSKVKQNLKKAATSSATGRKIAALSQEQIDKLVQNGNYSPDWKQVKAAKDFDTDRVYNCCFFGKVTLGAFQEKAKLTKGVEFDSGIYNSKFVDSDIGDNVLISGVKCIANYIVKSNAVLFNNGMISASDSTCFGNGTEVPIAIETGGREVKLYADLTIDEAAKVAKNRDDKKLLSAYEKKISAFCKDVTLNAGIIEEGAVIKNTQKIQDVFVGAYAVIDNAEMVKNTTILSNQDEKTEIIDGAYVRDSIVQWGCEVASGAIVDASCLTEHSHVERHGKVTQSILGPNTGIAEGEVTASLVGPFVGFHHQSLLIAAFWPEGKGNVGYGANVGSNHTSKAPDQEIWPGEGAFFGLGTNIKFPSDFSKAPYVIIASGVSALPQKVTFPFSLINSPAISIDGVSPAYNEIYPGWVLSDNIFTIKRNEGKYMKRNKAKRSKFIFEVLRPDIIELMQEARTRLTDIRFKKNYYTTKDMPGLGKNYMLESSRVQGVEAYTFYIRYYALCGLKKKMDEFVEAGLKSDPNKILAAPSKDKRWLHERRVLSEELKGTDVIACLEILSEMENKIAHDVQVSKEKDDRRGSKIIEGYASAHSPAAEDSFVKQTWKQARQTQDSIDALIKFARPKCKKVKPAAKPKKKAAKKKTKKSKKKRR